VITFPAWELYSLMHSSMLLNKRILCRVIVFTFPAWIILSFMCHSLVLSEKLKLLGGHIPCMGTSFLHVRLLMLSEITL
jgi:hypothetical protein